MNECKILLFVWATLENTVSGLETDLGKCLNAIFVKYFSGQHVRMLFLNDVPISEYDMSKISQFHGFLADMPDDSTYEIITEDVKPPTRTRNTVVFTGGGNLALFDDAVKRIKTSSYSNSRILVVLFSNGRDLLVPKKIFQQIWTNARIIDTVLMLVPPGDDPFHFYTWYPYERGRCQIVGDLRLIDTWTRDGFNRESEIFLEGKILRGLNDCPVLATTTQSEFFTMFEDAPDETSDGLDFRILRVLTERYGMNVIYVPPVHPLEHWVRVDANGSLSGTMRKLFDYAIDVGFSGMQLESGVLSHITLSDVYYMDTLQWTVPEVNVNEKWKSVVGVFDSTLWIAVGLGFLFGGFALFALNKIREHRACFKSCSHSLFTVFGLTLAQPFPYSPRSHAIRFFLLCYIVYSLNISTCYQSHLVGILTAPSYHNPYTSLEAAFELGLTIYFFKSDIPVYENDPLGSKILNSSRWREVIHPKSILREVLVNKSAAFMYGNVRTQYFIVREHQFESKNPAAVRFLPNIESRSLINFHFSPNNPLKELFDTVLRRLTQSGLLHYWEQDLLFPYRGMAKTEEQHFLPLTIQHLQSIFFLHGILIVFAFCTFLYELTGKMDLVPNIATPGIANALNG